jgi:hypothetical protein
VGPLIFPKSFHEKAEVIRYHFCYISNSSPIVSHNEQFIAWEPEAKEEHKSPKHSAQCDVKE